LKVVSLVIDRPRAAILDDDAAIGGRDDVAFLLVEVSDEFVEPLDQTV